MISAFRRLIRWLFVPVQGGMLPVRHWRWMWAAVLARPLIGLPLVLVTIVPYLIAKGLAEAIDWLGGQVGNIYVKCYNRDLKSSGWRPPVEYAPAIELNPEWVKRGRPE